MLSIDREAGPATAIAAIPAALALAARRPGLATVLAALPAGVALFFRDPERTPDHAAELGHRLRSLYYQ